MSHPSPKKKIPETTSCSRDFSFMSFKPRRAEQQTIPSPEKSAYNPFRGY